jgi:hypothetical protein
MTFSLPPGERRRTFLALCTLAFIGAAALVAAMLPAHAAVLALPTSNSGWSACGYGVCQWGEGSVPIFPRIIQVPQPTSPAEIDARDQRIKLWEVECDVKYVRDRYGVMRYIYSTPGCEYGSHP